MSKPPDRKPGKLDAEPLLSPALAKALAHPLRNQIVAQCYLRVLSPSDFCEVMGLDHAERTRELSKVARHFRTLAQQGLLEQVELRLAHGRPEHVYRAVTRMRFPTGAWSDIPAPFRVSATGTLLTGYLAQLVAAARSGTLEEDSSRHFSWKAIRLDRSGWRALMDRLDAVLEWIEAELEPEAAKRLASRGEEPIPTIVGIAGFLSAQGVRERRQREWARTVGRDDL